VPRPRSEDRRPDRREPDFDVAADDAARIASEVGPLIERALGIQWYEIGNDADLAAVALCRLRRARAGAGRGPSHGDAAVRDALSAVSPECAVWIASRAISYMDENGFPEAVEPFLAYEEEPA
jgi:hypothetical protein